MKRKRTWKIIDRGSVSEDAPMVEYGGPCGHDAMLPVGGVVIAETSSGGLVFDEPVGNSLPPTIRCRKCGRTYTNKPEVE